MQNNFCFLCKNQNMQRQEIDFTKLCWKFFLHFYLLQSSWNFVLARADIYHSNLRLSLFTQCCSYISSIHIYCIFDEGNTEKWLFVYSANYLYETKCDGFAGKVSERQFSYERWIGRNAQIFWFFLHKEDSWNSKFVQNVFKIRISKIASFCRLFSSAFPIGNYWISWTTQDWLSVWLLKPESFCQRMPRTIPSNRIWNN